MTAVLWLFSYDVIAAPGGKVVLAVWKKVAIRKYVTAWLSLLLLVTVKKKVPYLAAICKSCMWLFSYDVIAAPGEGKNFVDRMEEGNNM